MFAAHRLSILAALLVCGAPLGAQEGTGALEARVWLDRGGEEPVVRRGEDVRVYYRTSEDAFAAIFRIDTDGRVWLMLPQHPRATDVIRGRRDYRLLTPDGSAWHVDEDPGMGYLFIVASPEPLDFTSFAFDPRRGWDLGSIGSVVYSDPYVAIDDYVAAIVPDWEYVPYALDFLSYSVGETYSYPRFLCYDCHTYQHYARWNPYDYNCRTYRVVIWDDPFFYPRYRYSGVNVVVARPVVSLPRYEVTTRSLGDAVAPVFRVRTPAARDLAYKEAPLASPTRVGEANRRGTPIPSQAAPPPASGSRSPASASRRSAPVTSGQERPRATSQQLPDTARARPTLQRRPSGRLPVRTPPSARPSEPTRSEPGTSAPTRASPRAPITRPQSEPRAPLASSPSARPSSSPEPRTTPSAPRLPARTPSAQPSTGSRPQSQPRPTNPGLGGAGGRPGTGRPAASPTPSPRETPAPRPSAPSPRAEPRGSEPRGDPARPSVRPRPSDPPEHN